MFSGILAWRSVTSTHSEWIWQWDCSIFPTTSVARSGRSNGSQCMIVRDPFQLWLWLTSHCMLLNVANTMASLAGLGGEFRNKSRLHKQIGNGGNSRRWRKIVVSGNQLPTSGVFASKKDFYSLCTTRMWNVACRLAMQWISQLSTNEQRDMATLRIGTWTIHKSTP